MSDFEKDSPLTLRQIALKIKAAIDKSFPSMFWLQTEMVKLNFYPSSGHAFPDLVEKNGNQIYAQIRSTIWKSDLQAIRSKFLSVVGRDVEDGIKILCKVEVKYHEVYGLSLRIVDIDPNYTLGEMAVQRAKAIEALKQEGVFDKNRKLVLPDVPSRLAVISIATSKGYNDLRTILLKEGTAYRFYITLFPAILQGQKAVETIKSRIVDIVKRKDEFDAILIIRGGGDDAGMNCYDDYSLARHVAYSPLPVITGIGHSTNETVVEMVAHSNKITPTDVAYFLISKFSQQMDIIDENFAKLLTHTLIYFSEQESVLQDFAQRSGNSCAKNFTKEYEKLAFYHSKITELPRRIIAKQNHFLDNADAVFTKIPQSVLKANRQKLESHIKYFDKAVAHSLSGVRSKFVQIEGKISLLSPANVMKRGYSMTFCDGKILRSSKDVNKGDKIETVLSEGIVISKIEKTKNDGKS